MDYTHRLWINDTKPWQTVYLSPLSFGKYTVWEDELYVLFTGNQTCSQIPQGIYSLACRCEEIRKKAGAQIFSATTSDIHNYQQPTRKYIIMIDDNTRQKLSSIPLYDKGKLHQWEYWPHQPVIFQSSQAINTTTNKPPLWPLWKRIFLWNKSISKEEPSPILDEQEEVIKEQLKNLYAIMGCYMMQDSEDIDKEIDQIWRKEFKSQYYNPWRIAGLIARRKCGEFDNCHDITEMKATMLQTYRRYKADTITDIKTLEKIKADAFTDEDYELYGYIEIKIAQYRQNS